MSIRIGLDAKLYYNAGTAEAPDFTEIGNARDVTFNLELNETDVTVRANNGWEAVAATLKKASIEWEQQWRRNDPVKAFLIGALLAKTVVDLLVLDGAIDDPESEGLRAPCQLFTATRNEPLTESLTLSITAKPTLGAVGDSTPLYGVTGDGTGSGVDGGDLGDLGGPFAE